MARRAKKDHAASAGSRSSRLLRALRRLWVPALEAALVLGCLAPMSGCTRCWYREKADEEVSEILAQKDKYPAWSIDNWHGYADPRARFADPTDPDHPPMPPDDPAAYDLSPNPQKPKSGVARVEGTGYLELIAKWDRENRERKAREREEEKRKEEPTKGGEEESEEQEREPKKADGGEKKMGAGGAGEAGKSDPTGTTPQGMQDAIEQASERSLLDVTGRPTYLLTLDQAAELAMFNSREYQDAREELYLATLPVTQERFSFMAQFFAAETSARNWAGPRSPEGHQNNWTVNTGTGFTKLLPTGALLLLNFANTTVFNFLDGARTTSVTTLDFSAIQPLLRGGGQAVTLESLTESERALLYQIRAYARFRKQLYVEIASNSGGSISGGRFQPSGTLSNTGVSTANLGNSGLFPGVPPNVLTSVSTLIQPPASPGFLALNPAITPTPSGYLNTMLQKVQVYIDQENIDVLTGILLRFRGLLEGDVVGPLQVQNVEQQLLSGRSTLLSDQEQYLESLNAFKLELGVPTQLNIEMDDSLLRPLLVQFRRTRAITDTEQAAVAEVNKLIDINKAPRLRAELKRQFRSSELTRGTNFARTIGAEWGKWEKLTDAELTARLEALGQQMDKLLELQKELQKEGRKLTPANEARLRELNNDRDLGRLELALRVYEKAYVESGKPKKPDAAGERQRIRQFQAVASAWQNVLVVARDERWVKVRSNWPDLPRACVNGVDLVKADLAEAEAAAARFSLEHRLDLMNVRGQVVDSWRQLAIYANSLLGVFNVAYSGTLSTPAGGSHPLRFTRNAASSHLFLNGQLPLVRIKERNNYRASLIAYARQRRALEEAEDLTVQAVYREIYLLRQYAEQYKVQKRLLELAYLTIDSSLESLSAPTAPPAQPGQARTSQDGPAALTQQLLTAQRTLPTAQNSLLTIWINYLDSRLQLYRDLELMPLDARGVWLDEVRDCDCGITEDGAAKEPDGGSMKEGSPKGAPAPNGPPKGPPLEKLPEPHREDVGPKAPLEKLPPPQREGGGAKAPPAQGQPAPRLGVWLPSDDR